MANGAYLGLPRAKSTAATLVLKLGSLGSWAIESLAARLLPEIMPVTPDDLAASRSGCWPAQQPSRVEESICLACTR